jgi:hypothetical protein
MTELVLVFCLAGLPNSCHEERPLLEQMSPMSCVMQGQQYALEWLADHPKWALSGWRCEQNVPKHEPS